MIQWVRGKKYGLWSLFSDLQRKYIPLKMKKRPPLDFPQMVAWNGGGERWRKKVDNRGDFLKNMPRKEVKVPGLAFHVVIIGRNELKRIAEMNEG